MLKSIEDHHTIINVHEATKMNLDNDTQKLRTTKDRETVFLPAKNWIPTHTAGAGTSSGQFGAGDIMIEYKDFSPLTTQFIATSYRMPSKWIVTEPVTFSFTWKHEQPSAANAKVHWAIRAINLGNGDSLHEVVFPNAAGFISPAPSHNRIYQSDRYSPVPFSTPLVRNDILFLEVLRLPRSSQDTLATDAKLIGVELTYIIDPHFDN